MAHEHKGVRYGGRKCKSNTGKPAKTTSFRIPAEVSAYISMRVATGDAATVTEYLLGLVRKDAKRHGVTI